MNEKEERHMRKDEMIYLTAAKGERPEIIPIVIEVQMVVCPGFKELQSKYGFGKRGC